MVLFGISDGIRPIISYNFGAQNENRVNKTLKDIYYSKYNNWSNNIYSYGYFL